MRGEDPHDFWQIALREILQTEYDIPTPEIDRMPGGKPVLRGGKLQFGVTHTANAVVIAISENPVGLDIERLDRPVPVQLRRKLAFLSNDPSGAQPENAAFLRAWTVLEAVFKLYGGGVAEILRCLRGEPLPIAETTRLENEAYTLCVATERPETVRVLSDSKKYYDPTGR